MIRRRWFIAATAAATCLRSSRAFGAPGDALTFRVSRNGSEIGTHALTFTRAGNDLTVHIEARFRVHFGPITFYRYHHKGIEQWRDGKFASLDTQTDDNGDHFDVQATATSNGVHIRAAGQPDQFAPPNTIPLTHWAFANTGAKLFNPQNGKILPDTLQARGPCTVALADGARIAATRFALAGAAPIDDFYDDAKLWAALNAVAKDGSHITYRRL